MSSNNILRERKKILNTFVVFLLLRKINDNLKYSGVSIWLVNGGWL